jgi:aspartyl-tRNA synthetase
MLRTHTCGELRSEHIDQEVTLCGWVDTVRDHHGIVFIDLRDRYGIVQVTIEATESPEALDLSHHARTEWVIEVVGKVVARPGDMVNNRLETGEIEILSSGIRILNQSPTPPFPLDDEKAAKVNEEIRMEYRYLDLRRPSMQAKLKLRHKMTHAVRNYFDAQDFIEVETPILTKSTPEGARDYLVPNRITPGTFYALPQAPQQYKQLLMIGGVDRYFQMARCFRDEDLRADRQPEFTQIDVEMSYVEAEDIYGIIDGVLSSIVVAAGFDAPQLPLPRMTWQQAMDEYGSDKPDLRFGMKLTDLTGVFAKSEFKVFKSVIDSGGVIKAINAKTMGGVGARKIDDWTTLAKQHGMGGLAFIKVQEDGSWKSPIVKFFTDEENAALKERLAIEAGDLILFAAADKKQVNDFLGKLRLETAADAGLIPENEFKFTWVTDFPLFETNEEGRMHPSHHPFTAPHPDDHDKLDDNPLDVRAQAYDIVLNGVELGSGSIRIHDAGLQAKMFELLKISEEEKAARFGHLLKALSFGAPPHGGIALGFDRLAMLMAHGETIRDVIAFPKNHKGVDLMMDAPSPVDKKQLDDVYIELALPVEDEDAPEGS